MPLRSLTGSRAQVRIGNTTIAFLQNIRVSEVYALRRIEPVGSIETAEITPDNYEVRGSFSRIVAVDETMEALGLLPQKGVNADAHLLNLVNQADLIVDVFDGPTLTPIGRVLGMRIGGRDDNVPNRGEVTEDFQFEAKRLILGSELV